MNRQAKKYLKQLNDSDPKVRYNAVMALGKLGDVELLDELDRVANLDDHPRVRTLAAKAVGTLETLKQRQVQRERAAAAAADPDDPLLWPELSKEKMTSHYEREKKSSDWTYEQSLLEERRRKKETELARIQELEQQMRRRRWRRMPIRLLTFSLVLGVCVLAAFAARYYLDHMDDPTSKVEALEGLRGWLEAQQFTATDYQNLIASGGEINCEDLNAINTPEKPIWVTDDNEYLTDYTLIAGEVTEIDTLLTQFEQETAKICEGKQSVSLTDIDANASLSGIPLRVQRLSINTASAIEQALVAAAAEAEATETPSDGN